MYLTTSPKLLRLLMPRNLIWEIPEKEKALYLSFDDGPVAGITDTTLSVLDKFNARATFFCVGENVKKNPGIYKNIMAAGHAVGNHTFHHLNGWNTPPEDYYRDIHECAQLVNSNLFRPPYGRITCNQTSYLSKAYKIIMWSVISGDFDPSVNADRCVSNVLRSAKAGSIIVMHDGENSGEKMLKALPQVLDHFTSKGFTFQPLKL